jgi:hypothetical protein
MTAKTSPVLYLTPATKAEREALHDILAPYSWSAGEFGLILTNVAFCECVKSFRSRKQNAIRAFLKSALKTLQQTDAGDVCLNFGLVN